MNTQVAVSAAPPPGITTQYDITGGTRPGGGANLFHSFGDFGVPANNLANFLNDTAAATTNILARVTGGNVSNINGKIQTNGVGGFGAANLFLINPAGVVFGAGASLNVGGAFRVSTADYIKFQGGERFYANLAANSELTSASVEAFGFLAAVPTGITATSTGLAPLLEVPVGNTLSLIAGDIQINGPSSSVSPTLQARSGRIELVSVASVGEVPLAPVGATPAFSTTGFASLGNVTVNNGARVTVAAPTGFATPAGTILIRGGRLTVDGASSLIASTGGNTNAAPTAVDIQARTAVTVTNSSTIAATNQSPVSGTGNAGAVIIASETPATPMAVEISSNAAINASYSNNGKAADITIDAGSIKLLTGPLTGNINQTNNSTNNTGNGGVISLRASENIYIGPGSSITAQNFNGTGAGAQIVLTSPSVTLEGAGLTQQATIKGFTGGSGAASSVTFNVGTLELKGSDAIVNTKAQNTSVLGVPPTQGGGPILVQGTGGAGTAATSVILSGAGTAFLSETEGQGNGGNMTVNANAMTVTNSARVSANTIQTGNAGAITLNVGTLDVSNGGRIEGNTSSNGALVNGVFTNGGTGGTTIVQGLAGPGTSAASLTITGAGSGLFSTTSGSGAGGSITANAGQITMNTGGTVSAASSVSGAGGSVALNAGTLSLATNAILDSSTTGAGNAGTIQITTTGNTATIASGSVIKSSTTSTGDAGQIVVTTPSLMLDNGIITTSTSGAGNAGGITVNAGSATVQGGGQLSSSSTGTGAGGTTIVQGLAGAGSQAASLTISGAGSGLFSTTSGTGAGGSILANANQITISNGGTISAASTGAGVGSGNAGSITVNAGSRLEMNGSSITTQAEQASGGDITVMATDMIQLTNSKITTSVKGPAGSNGGNITIDPQFVVLQGSQIIAQAVGGNGGNINITAGTFLADPLSLVDASSQLGVSGQVSIQAPVSNLSGKVSALPSHMVEIVSLMQSSCLAHMRGGQISSLIQRGRDEAPAGPDQPAGLPLFASVGELSAVSYQPSAPEGSSLITDHASRVPALSLPLPSLSPLGRGVGEGDASRVTRHDPNTHHVSRITPHGLLFGSGELQIRGLSRLLATGGGSCEAA
ncbi:MAG: filamentous hemagglutinin N-terminal domain-containing protein [Chloroflexi bacterium]|nr:filamentous hemagglutinin N-terminal domain-containing protein [Chloroflexota bacterium]